MYISTQHVDGEINQETFLGSLGTKNEGSLSNAVFFSPDFTHNTTIYRPIIMIAPTTK